MITDAAMGTWCDYCKDRWGKKNKDEWWPQAQTQALVVCVSSNGQSRAYCRPCMDEVTSGWGKDSNESWTLSQQMQSFARMDINRTRLQLMHTASEFTQRNHRIKSRLLSPEVIEEVANV
jgi:hypothetical protein